MGRMGRRFALPKNRRADLRIETVYGLLARH
jgi:hypothetical protein